MRIWHDLLMTNLWIWMGFQQIQFPEMPVQFLECAHDRAENIACLFRQICANSAYKSRKTGIRARIAHQGTDENTDKFAS